MLNNPIPEFIEITTATPCPINCKICPQQKYLKAYGKRDLLTINDFKLALTKIPKQVGLSFAGFSEPFINPQCLDMMEHAVNEGRKVWLFSTLIGLKPENVERLANLKLSWFSLHLPDNLGNCAFPSSQMYRETLDNVLRTVKVNHFSRMNENFENNTRAGNVDGSKPLHRHGPFTCTKLSHNQFIMLPNLDVVLCCMDFGLKHKLGNFRNQTYWDIGQSMILKGIKANRFGWDGDCLCRGCLYSGWRYNFGKTVLFLNGKFASLF